MTTPRQDIVATALQIAEGYASAGTHEEGGNNRGDQVEFFQHMMGGSAGDPWCADFVSTCLVKAYARENALTEDRTALLLDVGAAGRALMPLSGYCPSLWKNAVGKGLFKQHSFTPSHGDLVLFDFEEVGEPHHVGFVLQVNHDGTLVTVEGNTSGPADGSQADGDGVFVKSRFTSRVFGYVHW